MIVIDARIDFEYERGMSRYIDSLVRTVAAVAKDRRFIALVRAPHFGEGVEEVVAPSAEDARDFIRKNNPHIYHVPYLRKDYRLLRALASAKNPVITVPDLIGYRRSDYYTRKGIIERWLPARRFRKYRRIVRCAARIASCVVTFSEFVRQEVVSILKIPGERVFSAPLAASSLFRPLEDGGTFSETCGRYGVKGPFFLYIGRDLPHKNIPGLVEAYGIFRKSAGGAAPCLLIIGQSVRSDARERLQAQIRDAGLEESVIIHDNAPDEDMVVLMNAATAFVFPSLDEGFGLPPLEAMACGTPVVCSQAASLPEAVGDAALLVDAAVPDALADGLRRIAHDEDLRSRLREAGPRHASAFTWEKTGKATIGAYDKAIRRPLAPIARTIVALRGM